ncbi:hypothetical protein H6P81_006394 [Aristolochia fimbriata]|uniref:Uncharacterized protein n=1 Tax=Aristolochia fimbriata TaxID=158543 RepID=A0AAV7EZD3_ARIFI|nr:hypothetical protein H6P81_006394 [Aristolochia fimbriata]
MSGMEGSDGETITILEEQLQAQAHIWNHIFSMANCMSLKCAVELGIPDIIQEHGRPIALSELVAAIRIPPSKAENFRRLLRLLVHNGIFSVQKQGGDGILMEAEESYDLTPCSRLLVKSRRVNVAAQVLMELDPVSLSPWEHLSRWFKKEGGSTPFEDANGSSLWDYAGQRGEVNRLVNEGMASDSRLTVTALIAKCGKVVFQGVKSVVDVGGGTGATARALARAFPDLKITVMDLPHVVAEAPKNVNDVVQFVAGDMFHHIPPADAVFLKWIFHCWSDEESVKILRRCREAIPEKGGKVIIVDMVVDPVNNRDEEYFRTQLFTDLIIMLHTPGKERDEQQWKKIFTEAGFSRFTSARNFFASRKCYTLLSL